jgi:prepilin-type N-terminal cleavage/methylation domain-containing protein
MIRSSMNQYIEVRMHPLNRHPRAFTIVELLVVIGIIAVLLGILIPVVSSVRKAAYVSASRNNVQLIANAIERYHTDYLSYPGIWSNAQIAAGQTLTGGAGTITMTENCVLALCGGAAGAWNTPAYASGDLGKGPITYGPNPKRKAAYIEANNKILSLQGAGLDPGATFGVGQLMAYTYETAMPPGPPGVPEFIDAFPQALPIIYVRARVKATGIVGTGDHQYDARDMLPYATFKSGSQNNVFAFDTATFPSDAADQGAPGTYPAAGGTAYSNVNFTGSYNYFRNASTNAARQADTYLLISPGEDRKYGTSDDICNFTF